MSNLLDFSFKAQTPQSTPTPTTIEQPSDKHFARNVPFAQPGPWATALSPMEEQQFQSWVKTNKVPFNPTEKTPDYDMRGYWKDVASKGKTDTAINPVDKKLHFPDTYKTPYHQSFSAESKYATPNNPFKWKGETLMDSRTGQSVYSTQP